MRSTVSELLELTAALVAGYLILHYAVGFASGVRTLSDAYVSAVKALQGPPPSRPGG
jgi:hypothetical protein